MGGRGMSERPAGDRGASWRRWRHGAYVLLWVLVAIVVLQNLEPTRFDVLFWSFGEVPKLVVVLASMALGVLLWELGHLLRRHSRGRSAS